MPRTEGRLRLSEEKRRQLGLDLLERIRSARSGMADILDRIDAWDTLYEGDLPEKNFPWPDCSNLCVPLTQWICDTYKARIADVCLSVSPLVLVEPPPGLQGVEYKERAQRVEGYLQGQCERMKLADMLADSLFGAAVRYPAALTKVVWREEMRQVRRLLPTEDPLTGETTLEPQTMLDVRYRGPRAEFVDFRNVVVWPLTARSLDEARIVGDRFSLSKQEVAERVREGRFDRRASELRPEAEEGSAAAAEFEAVDEDMGVRRLPDYEQLSFWEVIAPYDADGDGFAEDCVFTLEHETGALVRAMRYPYYHGIRYYDLCVLFPRPGRAFGRTMPQILEGVQREINAIHNQRVDAVTLAMTQCFLARASSTVTHDTLLVAPGTVTLVDDVGADVKQLDISPQVPGLDVEQIARDYAERASGVSDLSTGRETEEQKTATEVGLVASEAGIRFGDTIRAAQQSVVNIVRQVAGLCYQYGDDEELAAHGVERDDLIFPWRYVAHGNTGTANKAQQRQESMLLYDKLSANPLVGQDLTRLWRLAQDLLQAFDRTDTEAYLGTRDEASALMEQVRAAQQQAVAAQGGQVGGGQAGEPGAVGRAGEPLGPGGA